MNRRTPRQRAAAGRRRAVRGLVLVYVTCPGQPGALRLGRALVEERLAACANAIPGMRSLYWWQGRVDEARESVLVLKTRGPLLPRLCRRVRQLHPYELPCIIALPLVGGDPDYLAWLADETASATRRTRGRARLS
jgi:periplasmic divalent cation tolerance protein